MQINCLHDEDLSIGQLIPQFRKSDRFFPWSVNQHVALGRGLVTPKADTHQLFVGYNWQDRAIRELFIYAVT